MGKTAINLDSVIARNDDIVAGFVDADFMMMSIETGDYYQSNQMGAEIWEILESPCTVAALCDILESRFKATRDVVEREVTTFISELAAQDIIRITE